MSESGDFDCCPNDDVDCCTYTNTNSDTESATNNWFFWYLFFTSPNRRDFVYVGTPHTAAIVRESQDSRDRVTPRYVLRWECKIVCYILILTITIIGILLLAHVI
jgi:hypothetical protein